MTSAAEPIDIERHDARTLVGNGAVLGAATAVGVAVFSVLSSALSGTAETIVQILLVAVGACVFAYFPATRVRPRSVDTIAWAAMLGLLGALFFTVFDALLLRRLGVYHWLWDDIGGGSGFWYIPVWWMGSATLAWLGAWVSAIAGDRGRPVSLALTTLGIAAAVAVILIVSGLGRVHAATVALAFALALPVHIAIVKVTQRT